MNGTPILNASDTSLDQNSGTVPDVSDVLLSWFQKVQFILIKKVIVAYQVFELQTQSAFQGVIQPFSPKRLEIKPEGQRSWDWFTLHAYPTLRLKPDDVIWIQNTRYRVMEILDYAIYGYIEYHMINDYQDTSKAPVLPNESDITKFVQDLDMTDPLVLTVDISASIPDARDAIWCLYDLNDSNSIVLGAVQVLSQTEVQVTVFTPGNYRLIGAY